MNMRALLLPSLLLHAVAFLLQLSVLATSQTTEPEQQSCSSPKACGDLNVSYPFWVEEPGRPPCGSPPFQLKCNSSGAFLSHSMFQAYRVVTIFTSNNSFHVVDENLPLATGCPAPCFNISLVIAGLGVFTISKANSELRFLSRCSEPLPQVLPGFRRLPCDNSSFVGFGGRRAIPQGCLVSVVPILPVPTRDRHDYVASLRKGFLLEWTVVSGDCSKCTASGGECMYPDNGLGFSCNCPDGVHYPMICGTKTNGRKIIPIDWIYDHYAQDDGLQACDVTQEVEEIAKKMSLIGLWCIQILPMHRPTITNVLEMFERGLDELEIPSKQNFSQVLEGPAYNLDVESTSSSSPTITEAYSDNCHAKDQGDKP
ncbi:unnamed protein product [Urochloa humidicola]